MISCKTVVFLFLLCSFFLADVSVSSSKERGGGLYPHPSLSAAPLTKPSATSMMMKFGNKFFEVCDMQL